MECAWDAGVGLSVHAYRPTGVSVIRCDVEGVCVRVEHPSSIHCGSRAHCFSTAFFISLWIAAPAGWQLLESTYRPPGVSVIRRNVVGLGVSVEHAASSHRDYRAHCFSTAVFSCLCIVSPAVRHLSLSPYSPTRSILIVLNCCGPSRCADLVVCSHR